MFQTNVVENNKHIFFSNFFSENCNVYVIMWKNVVEPDGRQVTT